MFSAKGAVSRQPGASPQESNHPGNQSLKARFSSVMVLNPKNSDRGNQCRANYGTNDVTCEPRFQR
ncbi:MAG: hypothetical protein DME98_02750 [Verrucomicrobia bacterium]|nr:MAG: hypothetical protein DME98_02750 [Verrucomicrobiota bacterium]PYJ34163.1 MAG: hypothetical protein DME88_06005 [Verrucomicrobiota bacterium]